MKREPLSYPIWAKGITVERTRDCLTVTGTTLFPPAVAKPMPFEVDYLQQSIPQARWNAGRRKQSPHVQLANANTDDKLIDFTRRWGPVGNDFGVTVSRKGRQILGTLSLADAIFKRKKNQVVFCQEISSLQSRQANFAAAARLIAEIQSASPRPEVIWKHCTGPEETLTGLLRRETAGEAAEQLRSTQPKYTRAEAAAIYGEIYLCKFCDEYPLLLFPAGVNQFLEVPYVNPQEIMNGIYPLMVHFLRLELLRRDGHKGLGVCPTCDEVFAIERRGAIYCSPECAHRQSALDSYYRVGRDKRRKRQLKSKKTIPK